MRWPLLLLLSPSVAFAGSPKVQVPPEPAESDWAFDAKVSGGWRADYLRWKIRFPEGEGVDGTSVLTWSQMQSLTVGAQFEALYRKHWLIRATGSFGGAVGGINTDSDYSDGFQYSKSVSSARGSTFWETSLALGYRIPVFDDQFSITPLLGLQYNYAWLKIRGGRFTVGEDSGESLSDLNSSYRPNVFNGFAGLEASYQPLDWLRVFGGIQLGIGYYYARAQWSLRDDLAQPLSFVHNGLAWTIEGNLGAEAQLTRHWKVFTRVYSRGALVVNGRDRTQFRDGSSDTTQLANVTWATLGAEVGLGFNF